LLGFCFLLLAGVFHTGKDEFEMEKGYKNIFMILMLVGILAIFLHAIKTKNGTPWLYYAWNYVVRNFDTGAMGALILTLIIVGIMGFVTAKPTEGAFGVAKSTKDEEKKDDH